MLARTGTPDEIAGTVLWLLRDATYLTGESLRVDGGRLVARVPVGHAPSPGSRTGFQLEQVVTWPGTRADHGLA